MNKPKAESPKLKALQEQIAQLTEALQRERADVINVRRRHEEQISSLKTLVKANVVRDLLPVIDNFERALRHSPAESGKLKAESKDIQLDDWIKGVVSIKTQFDSTLASMGVERIKTVGEVFDPRLHEAVSMEDGSGTVEVVSEELQPGYKIGDDIIRHAMVKVKMESAILGEEGEVAK
jgi:molecular chaperone GrpE